MVVAGWADRDTDPVARDPDSAWAVVGDQAAVELVVAAEPGGAAAQARQEAAGPVVPASGNLVARGAAVVKRGLAPVDTVVEVEQVAGLDQEQEASVVAAEGQEPAAALRLQVGSPCRLENG